MDDIRERLSARLKAVIANKNYFKIDILVNKNMMTSAHLVQHANRVGLLSSMSPSNCFFHLQNRSISWSIRLLALPFEQDSAEKFV